MTGAGKLKKPHHRIQFGHKILKDHFLESMIESEME